MWQWSTRLNLFLDAVEVGNLGGYDSAKNEWLIRAFTKFTVTNGDDSGNLKFSNTRFYKTRHVGTSGFIVLSSAIMLTAWRSKRTSL